MKIYNIITIQLRPIVSLEHLSLTNYMNLFFCIRSLEAVEDINSNSVDYGKYPNYIQLYTKNKKKKEREK